MTKKHLELKLMYTNIPKLSGDLVKKVFSPQNLFTCFKTNYKTDDVAWFTSRYYSVLLDIDFLELGNILYLFKLEADSHHAYLSKIVEYIVKYELTEPLGSVIFSHFSEDIVNEYRPIRGLSSFENLLYHEYFIEGYTSGEISQRHFLTGRCVFNWLRKIKTILGE